MTPQPLDEPLYRKIKLTLKDAIERVRAQDPAAGEYLEQHLVFDDEKYSVSYTGDDRIKIIPIVHSETNGNSSQN